MPLPDLEEERIRWYVFNADDDRRDFLLEYLDPASGEFVDGRTNYTGLGLAKLFQVNDQQRFKTRAEMLEVVRKSHGDEADEILDSLAMKVRRQLQDQDLRRTT
jgi:hypothetical protein